jgi:uncharacterized protein
MKKLIVVLATGVAALLVVACTNSGGALKKNEVSDWTANLLKMREKTNVDFKNDPVSPMAGIGRLNVPAGVIRYLVPGDHIVNVSEKAADAVLMVSSTKGNWTWKALKEKLSVGLNGKAANSDAIEDGMQFHFGNYTLQAYTSKDRLTLIVFDSKRPELLHFQHLRYFEPNSDLVLDAKVERIKHPDRITMLTSRNLEKGYYRYAILHFKVNGENCQLTAYKMNLKGKYDHELFIPFRDATSGKESYGAGRFLELKETPGDSMRLDFNLAFNPLCNYSPAYNCPIPPAENTLTVPIRAGEMTYPHKKSEE